MATHNDNYTLGRGELWFRKAGDTTYRFMGNVPTFNLNVSSQKLEHFSSRKGVGEKDLSIITQMNRTASIVGEDISTENLALFFMGSTATLTQTAATAKTATFNAQRGGLFQLGESNANPTGDRKVSNVVVKKGATSLVADTDYAVDMARGTIEILETGSTVVNGDAITVTYDVAAASRKQTISGSTQVVGEMKYIAQNPQGDNIDYYLPKVLVSPNGDFAMIAENALQNIPLSLDVQTSAGRAAVYADGQAFVA